MKFFSISLAASIAASAAARTFAQNSSTLDKKLQKSDSTRTQMSLVDSNFMKPTPPTPMITDLGSNLDKVNQDGAAFGFTSPTPYHGGDTNHLKRHLPTPTTQDVAYHVNTISPRGAGSIDAFSTTLWIVDPNHDAYRIARPTGVVGNILESFFTNATMSPWDDIAAPWTPTLSCVRSVKASGVTWDWGLGGWAFIPQLAPFRDTTSFYYDCKGNNWIGTASTRRELDDTLKHLMDTTAKRCSHAHGAALERTLKDEGFFWYFRAESLDFTCFQEHVRAIGGPDAIEMNWGYGPQ